MNTEYARSKSISGSRRGRIAAVRSAAVRAAKADGKAQQLVPALTLAWKAGAGSYRALAKALNEAASTAPRGGPWTAMQLRRSIDRLMSEDKSGGVAAAGITSRQSYREFAETVRPHIYEALAAKQTTAMQIAHYLNGHGVRSHTGQVWSKWSVRYLRHALEGTE